MFTKFCSFLNFGFFSDVLYLLCLDIVSIFLYAIFKVHLNAFAFNGDGGIRTLDPLLARQVLSQLSYTPIKSGTHLLSHTVSSIVSSAA